MNLPQFSGQSIKLRGYDLPTSIWKHILIGIGPFFVNTLIGLAIGLVAYFSKGQAD